ncbi:uncharacterized protein NECHADRAFT_53539 [Fusarium vanettenii 77-13-4]|uniref:Zn(2)-C6 fungal-type domain-containing protein n=1 Tax=Fusarium vanettenii (strain ATCC MYA-4622 / CBS 123669 / FGSC 9596 / NRRL 45880 / 77-13-4) TaxID=660122 RepID=C7ZEC2_FUSV7|nr:uncharacterized protein NECHADRAFT_53539 [Fusarium vanettenii 77-13-4]EEU37651.1 hypothetical protein NECHADRAFT_53539 [Fusarium vanettenii 77-13-4]
MEPPNAAVARKPYHTKRTHTKSRNGCKVCKTRRVKCDEARPACRSCVMRNAICVYPQQSPPPPPRARAPSPVSEPLFIQSPVRDAVDMKLLWFYTSRACSTTFIIEPAREARVTNILKVDIPRIAFSSPFLMDCLLATSALQLELLGQDVDMYRAVRYRSHAFHGYRKAIAEAKPETFPAIIACSILLTNLASHMFREEGTEQLYIINWMTLWRGISHVIDLVSPKRIWESGLAELFLRPCVDPNQSAFYIPSHVLSVVASIEPGDEDHPSIGTYYAALRYLGSLYFNLSKNSEPVMNLRILTWFTYLPESYVELCRKRRPRALIILAHYLVFIKLMDTIWWAIGIGNREIRGIISCLGDKWSSKLSIPRRALSIEGRLEIARLLLDDQNWEFPVVVDEDLSSGRPISGGVSPGFTPPTTVSPPQADTRGFQQDKITLAAMSTNSWILNTASSN